MLPIPRRSGAPYMWFVASSLDLLNPATKPATMMLLSNSSPTAAAVLLPYQGQPPVPRLQIYSLPTAGTSKWPRKFVYTLTVLPAASLDIPSHSDNPHLVERPAIRPLSFFVVHCFVYRGTRTRHGSMHTLHMYIHTSITATIWTPTHNK